MKVLRFKLQHTKKNKTVDDDNSELSKDLDKLLYEGLVLENQVLLGQIKGLRMQVKKMEEAKTDMTLLRIKANQLGYVVIPRDQYQKMMDFAS